jgi:hypothetical protein
MLEQTIRGTESGLSPDGVATFHTPNTTGLDGGSNSRKALKKRQEKFPTPTSSDYKDQPTSKSWKEKGAINFKLSNPEIRAKWPTPRSCSAMAATITPESAWDEKRNPNLETIVGRMMWPTPDANCGQRGTQPNWTPIRKSGHPAQYSINQAVRDAEKIKWPTPQASDHRDRGNMSNPAIQRRAEKGKQLNLSMVAHPNSGKLNPDWVEWLMNWPIKWSDINGFNKKEFERWTQESATAIQNFGQMRTMWWNSDPSQTPLGSQPIQQSEIQHSDSLSDMSWDITRQREMERSHQREDMSLLRDSVHIQESKRENLQSGMWEQVGMDETQIIPRVSDTKIASKDRLKAIGNGQVPLCAATAFRILSKDL